MSARPNPRIRAELSDPELKYGAGLIQLETASRQDPSGRSPLVRTPTVVVFRGTESAPRSLQGVSKESRGLSPLRTRVDELRR